MATLKFKDDPTQVMAEENRTNGMTILGRYKDTLFVRLPIALQKPCGNCTCDYCKAHPNETPAWDTLAMAIPTRHNPTNAGAKGSYQHTWTVHMPDTAAFFRIAQAAKVRKGSLADVIDNDSIKLER